MDPVILNLDDLGTFYVSDDFRESEAWRMLERLRSEIPRFRVTLFTVVGNCASESLGFLKSLDWIDIVPHGLYHENSYECAKWTVGEMRQYLDLCESLGLTHGFKAPGWQISDGCYEALWERGWWVADQSYNDERRPAGLAHYVIDSPNQIHGHVGTRFDNELSKLMPKLLSLRDRDFGFVRDAVIGGSKRVDIVIPNYTLGYGLASLCIDCLTSIREHTPESLYRLVFVDNGSPGFDAIAPFVRQHPHLLIRNSTNVGFVKAVNQGLAVSNSPYVVLMNNDTRAVDGWLTGLLDGFTSDEIAAVGPRTTTPESWQGRAKTISGVRVLPKTSMLAFFCVALRRTAIDRVGFLDESFGTGLGDDDEYCARLHRHGYRIAFQSDIVIPHEHRATFRTLYSETDLQTMQDAAMSLYRQKCAQT